jgi:hypothetical protein
MLKKLPTAVAYLFLQPEWSKEKEMLPLMTANLFKQNPTLEIVFADT